MISGMVLQFFTLVSGFILPKIILTCFGSEVNGLVSSLNQFLSYITLVEGGITGVIIANLYKPFSSAIRLYCPLYIRCISKPSSNLRMYVR